MGRWGLGVACSTGTASARQVARPQRNRVGSQHNPRESVGAGNQRRRDFARKCQHATGKSRNCLPVARSKSPRSALHPTHRVGTQMANEVAGIDSNRARGLTHAIHGTGLDDIKFLCADQLALERSVAV